MRFGFKTLIWQDPEQELSTFENLINVLYCDKNVSTKTKTLETTTQVCNIWKNLVTLDFNEKLTQSNHVISSVKELSSAIFCG